jgi:rhomboid protease GluP
MSSRPPGTPGTLFIMGAIVAGFAVEILTGAWKDFLKLAYLGAVVPSLVIEHGQYWRLLSAMFLHGDGTVRMDLLHVGLNLWTLWQVGRLYEVMFGTKRFMVVYFATGLFASIVSLLHFVIRDIEGASVGASGALFGIVGALVISIRRSPRWRNQRWARSIMEQLIFFTIANLAIGFTIPQIDMGAHVGGLVGGLILGAVLSRKEPPLPPSEAVIDVTPTTPSAR